MQSQLAPEGGNREWLVLMDGANDALAKGELERAGDLARKAADLDRGTSVAAWHDWDHAGVS